MDLSGQIAAQIRVKALELGFTACGFSTASRLNELEHFFEQWIAEGKHGTLDYLEKNRELRMDPTTLLPGTKTVISLAASYYFPSNHDDSGNNLICRYARGKDYHKVMKAYGEQLLAWMNETFGPLSGRVFVDSGPIFEKEWARRSGIGWIGKHGLLIIPGKGSWLFLCEILTDLVVEEKTEPVANRCGTCTRCIEACPTGAIASTGRLNPPSCIAYLTIEDQVEVPDSLRGKWKHTVFGCDICQEVCPWNAAPEITRMDEFIPDNRRERITPETVRSLTPEAFLEKYGDTALIRTGLKGILRNFAFIQDMDPDALTHKKCP
ncbi:MAG: tRNA epoxyqueuosine(34) reductase QueG [Bacteroidota bacterium]